MKNNKFNTIADSVLTLMVKKANDMGVHGCAVVSCLESDDGVEWLSRMMVTGALRTAPKEDMTGYNFVGVAYAKMCEMMDTKHDSGSKTRPVIYGELGYPGGAIRSHEEGFIAAAFSGASSEEDYEISNFALDFMESGK